MNEIRQPNYKDSCRNQKEKIPETADRRLAGSVGTGSSAHLATARRPGPHGGENRFRTGSSVVTAVARR